MRWSTVAAAAAAVPGASPLMGSASTGTPPGGAPAEPSAPPERPQLGSGVHLNGQMTESAYVNPPWLIDRDGVGYLQVSELLYKVAEKCDGTRSPADIAQAITDAGEPVQPQTIERLISGMLVPAGVVVGPDGQLATPSARPRSPLALAGRMRMLGPGAIEPLTAVLRVLFWPPLILLIVALALATRAWLYLANGVAGPAHETLYHPVDLLILFALVVFSAGFHEFGHAAALRYGGGKVRGMGVGLYLIYPAVYTDVTENYRLSRWARVRTDLGGFHFNLIFSLAVFAVAMLSHQHFLLVFLLLTDIEILQQSLPFARFDGYWALADVTGIPDFFSHMGLFWRRLLRLPLPPAGQTPELKTWGKITLAVYSLVTVPVLLLFLFLTIAALPRVLATAWDSGRHQLAAGAAAWSHHDLLGLASSAFQIVILAFPVVAIAYLLIRTFTQFETRLWTWSRGSVPKRAVAGLATLALLSGCGFVWAPSLPHGTRGPGLANLVPIAPNEHGTLGDLAVDGTASLAAPIGIGPAPAVSPGPQDAPVAAPSAAPSAASTPVPVQPSPSTAPKPSSAPSPSPTH